MTHFGAAQVTKFRKLTVSYNIYDGNFAVSYFNNDTEIRARLSYLNSTSIAEQYFCQVFLGVIRAFLCQTNE